MISAILSALVLIASITGLCWLARSTWRLGAARLEQQRADRVELDAWRSTWWRYDRWFAEFPQIDVVLTNMRAEIDGKKLSDNPNAEGPWRTGVLRERLRAGVCGQELLRQVARKVATKLVDEWEVGSLLVKTAPPEHASLPCGGTIQTAGGHYFDFLSPERSVFDVTVIAAALSKLCRFTGHCNRFYSVAQHAVLVSYAVPPEHAYEALHHDDAEAFINDMAKPLKELLPDYQRVEARVQAAVFNRLGLPAELPACVKHADRVLLATEQRDLMPMEWVPVEWADDGEDQAPRATRWVQATERQPWWTLQGVEPLSAPIHPWGPDQAQREYLRRHYELLALRTVHAEKARAA